MNPRCAPQRVHRGHLSNQRADIGWHARPPCAMSALPCPEQAKAAAGARRARSLAVRHGAPRASHASAATARPTAPINCRESEPWTARTIDHGELVSECDDLQVQGCAGANEKAERVEQRNDDRRHESRLSKNVGNLNRHNVYGVSIGTGRPLDCLDRVPPLTFLPRPESTGKSLCTVS